MDIREIAEGFAVTGQIEPQDIAKLVNKGFSSIICNRPDGEAPGQPSFAEIEMAAKAAGLTITHIPVTPGVVGQAEVAAMRNALETFPKPILAFCRSGARSGALFDAARQSTVG